ncbi:malonyl-CoA decarboxylase, mitochondrial [Folsomia candida]|uniref:malonyl-CoA decarboxylase, mitochondrial n=1 Tax=Folsomia candida TaxID=158441 RepID=UPI000B8EF7C2|nr:malonyl-CoA decarboxylase, mitochondrial [Folsomia candida]
MSLFAQKTILFTIQRHASTSPSSSSVCSGRGRKKRKLFNYYGVNERIINLPVIGTSSFSRHQNLVSRRNFHSKVALSEGDVSRTTFSFSERKVRFHQNLVVPISGACSLTESEVYYFKPFMSLFARLFERLKEGRMASMLLPIIGSPPDSSGGMMMASSPMDDFSALTGPSAFSASDTDRDNNEEEDRRIMLQNRRFTLRRKLSTSFDDPQTSMILGVVAQKVREDGEKGKGVNIIKAKEGADTVGGAWLEEHFRKFSTVRISECSEGDADDDKWSVGSSGSSGSGGGGGGKRIRDDIFKLLEKVIEFKGRNVSHITVEQCVKDLCTVYNDTEEADKLKFFNILGASYGVDHLSIVSLANSLSTCQDEQTKLNLEEKLRTALIPKYQWLFSQVGRLDNGVKFLVDLRTDVLEAIEKSTESTTLLKPLNNCLKELIGVWFAVGFLKLERVTWSSPCEMLQKISEYEAVHPMRNWTDLKKRVGSNRRCFVFTHGSMPSEPVVVLHTALTNNIPSSIHKIVTKKRLASLDTENDMMVAEEVEDHDFINTAIFYSITSTQKGLTGIELGNYLIKKVVRELQIEFPKMHQFSSLSPIPGFTKWLIGSLKTAQRNPDNQQLLSSGEIQQLSPVFKSKYSNKDFFDAFLDSMKLNAWYSDNELSTLLEAPLMRLCAQYLYLVKRRGYALDPVAHFHLKNGAVLWRINFNGDVSPRGLTNSCGMMVNYRYFLDDCENNSQNYLEEQIIQISDQVRALVKQNELLFNSNL